MDRRNQRKRAVVRQLIGEQLETRRVLATLAIKSDNAVRDEGDTGFTNFTFTVTRGGVTSGVSTVEYSVSGNGDSPANVNDFNGNLLPTGTVSFGSGQTSKTITITVTGDRDQENDETFAVTLSNPSFGDTISTASATGTIRNDDLPEAPSLSIEAANATRDEGDAGPTAFTFTVTRSGNLNTATTVDYNVTGSGDAAADVNDFNSNIFPTGTVSFASGQASRTLTINVDGDLDFEPDESFAVTLINPSGGATIDTATATGAISNDDVPPAPSLSIATANAVRDEGDTGTTPLTFTVTRSGNLANATTVDYTVVGSGDSPANVNDFNGNILPTGTIGFASGQTSRTITINVSGDRDLEGDETFRVTLSNPSGGATIADATAIGTIRNDDVGDTPSLAIVAADAIRDEGDSGATPFTFTIVRGGQTSVATSVQYVVSGGLDNPADVSDFSGNMFPSGTVSFAAGQTSQTITINVIGDTNFESDETFLVTLNSPTGNAVITEDTAAGTITNDDSEDTSQLAISATNATRPEQDNGLTPFTFTVTRSGNTSGAITVDYAVDGSGGSPASASDFEGSVLPSGTVNFADGVTSQVITINVAGDFNAEEDESFTVTLSNAFGGATITTAIASGTIQNDDMITTPVAELAIAETDAVRSEGDEGSTAFTFTVTRGVVTSEPTTVDYAVIGSGENPASASDFNGNVLPTGTVSFAVGETSKLITVNVTGDRDEEFDESFLVTLSNASGQAIINTATANGVIQNDDQTIGGTPLLSISADEASRNEGDAGATPFTFTVTRSGLVTGATSVDYLVTGTGTNPATASDFAGNTMPSGVVDFAAGETSKTITINVIGDTVDEDDETFVVTLSNATDQATITNATSTGTILNDDEIVSTTAELAIAAADAISDEGDFGSTELTFTISRSGATDVSTSVDYAVTGSGASPASANDFAGNELPSGTIFFAIGELTKTITVNVDGDLEVEDDETFTVTLSNATNEAVIRTATANGIILDDDNTVSPTSQLAIVATDADRDEGDSGATGFTFTVTRSGSTTGVTDVEYTVSGSGTTPVSADDFVNNLLPSGTIRFNDGETMKSITVNVSGDTNVENDETFTIMLSNVTGQAIITTGTATGTIVDDDATTTPTTQLAVTADDAIRDEGDGGSTQLTFMVTRSGSTVGATSVSYAVTGSGTNPASADDFVGNLLPSGTIGFAAGETTKMITINVAGDLENENDETFAITLSNPSDQATIVTATAFGTIRNDDNAVTPTSQLAIMATGATVNEGDSGSRAISFTVTRGGSSDLDVSVNYSVLGSGTTPATSNDFFGGVFPSGTLRFAPGETVKTITVGIAGDTNVENDETFIVRLSNPTTGAVVTNSTATGTILDDDHTDSTPVILTPSQIVGEQVIPASNSSTAILFETVSDTTVSITLEGTPSSIETATVIDRNGFQISSFTGGVSTANVIAGEIYAIFFQPQSQARAYSIASSAGSDAVSNNPPSNILQPTDVNASGDTSATDALQIINELNRRDGFESEPAASGNAQTRFLDVNEDGHITALDALIVINVINERDAIGTVAAEGELAFSIPQQSSLSEQTHPTARDEQVIDNAFASTDANLNWISLEDSARREISDVDSPMRASEVDAVFNDRNSDTLETDLINHLDQVSSLGFLRSTIVPERR
jgi:hypothetical protein